MEERIARSDCEPSTIRVTRAVHKISTGTSVHRANARSPVKNTAAPLSMAVAKWRASGVPGAEFGRPFDHCRADFDQDQLDPGEEHIELGQGNHVARPQRLRPALQPGQARSAKRPRHAQAGREPSRQGSTSGGVPFHESDHDVGIQGNQRSPHSSRSARI